MTVSLESGMGLIVPSWNKLALASGSIGAFIDQLHQMLELKDCSL